MDVLAAFVTGPASELVDGQDLSRTELWDSRRRCPTISISTETTRRRSGTPSGAGVDWTTMRSQRTALDRRATVT